MPKQIISDVAQQLKQLGQDTFEQVVKQPADITGKAFESLGVGGPAQTGQKMPSQMPSSEDQLKKIAQMSQQDKTQSEAQATQIVSQIKEIEAQMERARQEREAQLRQRRQEPAVNPNAPVETPLSQQQLEQPSSKPKRGLLGSIFGKGRRVKSAQDQAQPETAGKRVGG